MLRALVSAIVVLGLAATVFLVYSNYIAPRLRTDAGGSITADGTPPAPPKPAVSPQQPPPAPKTETATPVPPPLPPAPPKLKRTHVVQPGDSLSAISRKYYGNPDLYGKIAVANGLRSHDRIRVGQVLVIPDGPSPPVILETADDENQAERTVTTSQTGDVEPQPPTLNATRSKDAAAPQK